MPGACVWYWDGSRWLGPQPAGGCTTCDSTMHPSNPPPQPGTVFVPCPLSGERALAEESSEDCCATIPIPDGHYLFFPAGSLSLHPYIQTESAKSQVGRKKRGKK